jgi:hypothetical protein
MALKEPLFASITGVLAALRLLLDARDVVPDRDIVVRARFMGLVSAERGEFWKVDGTLALRLLRRSLHRLPTDNARLSLTIRGLGEMKARCDADLVQPLVDYFRPRYRRQLLLSILDDVGKTKPQRRSRFEAHDRRRPLMSTRDSRSKTRPQERDRFWMNAVAAAQLVTTGSLDWKTFQAAYLRGGRASDIGIGRNYGLSMIFQVVLAVDPTILNDWIAARPNDLSLAAIARVAIERLTFTDRTAFASSLLRSRNRALQCLAAAAIVFPVFQQGPDRTVRQCWQLLVDGGIDSGDAIWVAGARLKHAIHARYWAEDQKEQQAARLHLLRRKPDMALGGSHNAPAEIRSCEMQLQNTSQTLAVLLPDIEIMLSEMAECWPTVGLSNAQMDQLENIFVSKTEFRHRLAAKLTHAGNRERLLKDNIDQLRDFIGLTEPKTAFERYFLPDAKTFRHIATWSAKSLVLHFERDNVGAGRRTSRMVHDLTAAAEDLLDEPFAAARHVGRWQSAIDRLACAISFAMSVVDETPVERRGDVQILTEHALSHARRVLAAGRDYSSVPLKQLALNAARQLGYFPSFEASRTAWVDDDALPSHARALALWTAPDQVRQRGDLACRLFRDVARLPPYHSQEPSQLGQLLTLLDTALASCRVHAATDLMPVVVRLWTEESGQWVDAADGRWVDAAQMIVGALEGPGPARDAFLADPTFAHTACVAIINAAASAEETGDPTPL